MIYIIYGVVFIVTLFWWIFFIRGATQQETCLRRRDRQTPTKTWVE